MKTNEEHLALHVGGIASSRPILAVKNINDASPLAPTDDQRLALLSLKAKSPSIVPDSRLLSIHGWLHPNGDLFSCTWQGHTHLQIALGFAHESDIEQAGYVKLTRMRWCVEPRYRVQALTIAQWETIESWYERNSLPLVHFERLVNQS